MTASPDEMEEMCSKLLPEATAQVLEELCTTILKLQIPPATTGKKSLLFKLLMKNLYSDVVQESEDGGLSTYLAMHEVLTRSDDAPRTENNTQPLQVKSEPGTNGLDRSGVKTDAYLEFQKLKEFKIHGKIGGMDDKSTLSYTSLFYQISNAKKLGYSEEVICNAVIVAISPGSHLRTYLESKPTVTLVSLTEILRSHYHEKDSASVFTELSNAVQTSNESCMDFTIRLMCLREKVLTLSEEEGCPYNRPMVSKRFSQTVLTGPDFSLPFVLHTDASGTGLGAVLYQRQGKELRVISFASRTLTPAERNYHLHSGKLEFLALKWAVTERFSDYLNYGPPFEIFTDNNPLTYVMTTAKLNACGLRWVAQLANYQFSLHYRSGKLNVDADYLSRLPAKSDTVESDVMRGCDSVVKSDDVKVVLSGAKSGGVDVTADVTLLSLPQKKTGLKMSNAELAENQRKDGDIGPVYEVLKNGKEVSKAERKRWSKRSKVLMKQKWKLSFEGEVLIRETKENKQIVIPEVYKELVFNELHVKLGQHRM